MKISVVIATLGRNTLKSCVESLRDADEIIVVEKPELCCVDSYNYGYKQTHGDFILHTNDRAIFDKGWREKTEEAIKKINYFGVVSFNPNIVISGCISRSYLESIQFGHLFIPDYIHYYPDMEMGEVSRKKHCYIETLGFVHYREKTGKDQIYDPKGDDAVNWDKQTYYEREKLGFPNQTIKNSEERQKIINDLIS